MSNHRKVLMMSAMLIVLQSGGALAETFNIPAGNLDAALNAYAVQTGATLLVSNNAIKGVRTTGAAGALSQDQALNRLLSGTGFTVKRTPSGALAIVPGRSAMEDYAVAPIQLAQATSAPRPAVETVTVTSSKLGGADVQSIPISITALSQEQLTSTQTAGGPDLVRQVPNLTFTKTNFTGYSIQIRGIGTQAISVTTDPAVAVAMNDMPFLRNHFFEQEFFDLAQVQVLRGPQGTLYGRNATAGVVNLTTAKPTDQFEAMASAEFGNYGQKRFEGMINIPLVDDRLAIRVAGEWTKRNGYSFNETSNSDVDGRDLWSGRLSIGWKPSENLQTTFVWEHFSEDDDRLRSSKQTCERDPGLQTIGGVDVGSGGGTYGAQSYNNQGCLPASFYSKDAFQVPNGFSLPYYGPTSNLSNPVFPDKDPYANASQSTDLRHIESQLEPEYKAKNDIVQFNVDYRIMPALTFTSQTGYNSDYLWSTEDYNRFNTVPGVFDPNGAANSRANLISADGTFCDPQLGCSNKLVAEDLATEHSWQFNQEVRLASNFSGPFNFSVGANYMHYETMEKYYVFINSLSLMAATAFRLEDSLPYDPSTNDNAGCVRGGKKLSDPTKGYGVEGCIFMDTGSLNNLNDKGHNYFLSQNPYIVDSYAGFGETYYNITQDLKLTGGLRWTADRKHFPLMPSWLLAANSFGYPVAGNVDQSWDEFTGRAAVNWTPHLDFTDQTLIYGSYAHGYKAGGANPPPPIVTGAVPPDVQIVQSYAHPLTFKPEFVDAFELGTKNTLLDGELTLNGDVFYYNYQGYQISEIVDRTSVNQNFDAHIKGAELEMTWEPVPGLRFNAGGGYEDARLANGSKAIDLMDRTAGHTDWFVSRPFPTDPSNCILPTSIMPGVVAAFGGFSGDWFGAGATGNGACVSAYKEHVDPLTGEPYASPPAGGYPNYPDYQGFNPASAPNNGEGFTKDLSHNEMPNAPPFTLTFGAQYTMPISPDWAATLRSDLYWQDASYWRVFNDLDYDKLHAYSNLNLSLILTSQNGWQAMAYVKNVFDTTAITGAFLNSDDSGLTTNVFLTDPRLFGIRITRNW